MKMKMKVVGVLMLVAGLMSCGGSEAEPWTLSILATPLTGTAPLTVSFTATPSTGVVEADKITWSWDFGDGATDTVRNPTHVFQTAGVYLVTCQGTDVDGNTSTVQSTTITVD